MPSLHWGSQPQGTLEPALTWPDWVHLGPELLLPLSVVLKAWSLDQQHHPGNLLERQILRPCLRRRVRHSGDGAQRSVL